MDRSTVNQTDWEKEGSKRGGCARIVLMIGLLLLGVAIGILFMEYTMDKPDGQEEGRSAPSQENPSVVQQKKPEEAIQPRQPVIPTEESNIMTAGTVKTIVEQCGDAVVRITTEIIPTVENDLFFGNPLFRDYFDEQQPRNGMGSGFLFRANGFILTNNHVLEGASSINVYLTSRNEPYKAEVIGRAPELDLAVIKIDGERLPYLEMGDSEKASVGDWVIAIGNPYGLDHTVTVGVISAKGRPLIIEGTVYQNLLQTDAAINLGNSGGPMLNLSGQVIGINTAINAVAQGIGFAIPASTVLDVLSELESGIERKIPWIGISMQPMSRDMLRYFHIEGQQNGVIVYSVIGGSPAEKSGIRRGDVLLEIDGQSISEPAQVSGLILRHRVGDKVMIKVYRDGEEIDIMVELEVSQIQK